MYSIDFKNAKQGGSQWQGKPLYPKPQISMSKIISPNCIKNA